MTSMLTVLDNKNLILKPNSYILATFLVHTFILAFTNFNLVRKYEIASSSNVFSVKFTLLVCFV